MFFLRAYKLIVVRGIYNVAKFSSNSSSHRIDKIRNIGILAHIDAGKTTTTERMLFYSGKTNYLGEVHRGNTVTDFLSQERERGITICSSAVAFNWNDYRVNLLDTPGHIDFTMEVEQSLNAVDGIVVILDASAGVEAQTITVWTQADRHKLPRMVFANKMDRADADFDQCLMDVKMKLNALPVAIQEPIMGKKGINGIIDIIELNELQFDLSKEGRIYNQIPLEGDILKEVKEKRCELVDTLSEFDDILADEVITTNSLENIDSKLITTALRKATIDQKIVPVLLGSAYKNTGVQPLIDSVISLLPSPNEKSSLYKCFENEFSGRVFKVMHDKQRGPLSLVRVMSGKLKKGDKVTNCSSPSELIQRIYEPLADEYRDIHEVGVGNVGVCAGLKNTSTGDLLVSNPSALKAAERKLNKMYNTDNTENAQSEDDSEERNDKISSETFKLKPTIPDAVYFCSIEPPSQSYQLELERALAQLQREDPSLRVRYDESTMQTVLGGMGELHLDIVKSRILSEYKIEVDLGPLQIAYKETILDSIRDTFHLRKEIGGALQEVKIEMSLVNDKNEHFSLSNSPDEKHELSLVRPKLIAIVRKAAQEALLRGPIVGGEVANTQVVLHSLIASRGVVDSFLISATVQCIQKLLQQAGCRLLEPIMSIQIISPADRTPQVMADLARRRAEILEVYTRGENRVINVNAPLAELGGYSSKLRTITSGASSMTMQPNEYSLMTPKDEQHAIRRAQGLE